jgi:hypothetical protein
MRQQGVSFDGLLALKRIRRKALGQTWQRYSSLQDAAKTRLNGAFRTALGVWRGSELYVTGARLREKRPDPSPSALRRCISRSWRREAKILQLHRNRVEITFSLQAYKDAYIENYSNCPSFGKTSSACGFYRYSSICNAAW